MNKPKPEFSLEQLFAQLKPEEALDGIATSEICMKLGLPVSDSNLSRIRRRIRALRVEGLIECVGMKPVVVDYGDSYKETSWQKAYRKKE